MGRSYCPYCGNSVKGSDKFCIMCGKPLLSDISKMEESPKAQETVQETPKKKKKEKEQEAKEEELDLEDEEEPNKKKAKEETKEVKTLPDDVKRQIELHLELDDVNQKKQILADKLKDLTKQLKSSKYATDFEYGEKIEIQLEAVKTVIKEVKERENELKAQVEGEFIINELKKNIDTKKSQLSNLMREYKLKKIRDKDVVKSLKKKYKSQLAEYEAEYTDLILGIKEWMVQMREEKVDLETEQKTNKARYKAGEIDEQRYNEADAEYVKKISNLEAKLKTLKEFTK